MVKHVVIVSDRARDNISIYTEEPAFLGLADRSDLNALRDLDEANRSGIYILMGENIRYVGQASNSIYNRLAQHDRDESKSWWSKVLFFGREDGHLDKSQTDYLEQKLIVEFKKTSLQLANANGGNSSYIDKTSKILSENVWTIAQEILKDVVNLDIFEEVEHEEDELNFHASKQTFIIQLPNGKEIISESAQANQLDLFYYLLESEDYRDNVLSLVIKGKPSPANLLGTEASFQPNGKAYTSSLEEGLYLYRHFSTKSRKQALKHFLEQAQIKVKFHWND